MSYCFCFSGEQTDLARELGKLDIPSPMSPPPNLVFLRAISQSKDAKKTKRKWNEKPQSHLFKRCHLLNYFDGAFCILYLLKRSLLFQLCVDCVKRAKGYAFSESLCIRIISCNSKKDSVHYHDSIS